MSKRILITGANGFIGNRLLNNLKEGGFPVFGLDLFKSEDKDINICDISDRSFLIKKLNSFQPDIILHCAAVKNLTECEKNKELSFKSNVLSTEHIVQYARQNLVKVIYISSDVVFNGKLGNYSISSPFSPINWYGKTKCFSELLVQGLENYAICRTALVIGRLNNSYKQILNDETKKEIILNQTVLPQFIYKRLISGCMVKLSDEIISNPTPIELLTKFIFQIIKHNHTGTFNTAGIDSLSRYEFGEIIANSFKLDKKLLIKDKDNKTSSSLRPKNISLNTKETFKILKVNPIDWHLKDYLSNIKLYE